MNWWRWEKHGWSWAVGWNRTRAAYYAQAWRDLPRPKRVDGMLKMRDCLSEHGRSVEEAERKLEQRLEQVHGTDG